MSSATLLSRPTYDRYDPLPGYHSIPRHDPMPGPTRDHSATPLSGTAFCSSSGAHAEGPDIHLCHNWIPRRIATIKDLLYRYSLPMYATARIFAASWRVILFRRPIRNSRPFATRLPIAAWLHLATWLPLTASVDFRRASRVHSHQSCILYAVELEIDHDRQGVWER